MLNIVKQQNSQEQMLIKSMFNTEMEKKNPRAWAKVKRIGRSISRAWKAKMPSWQVISVSRR